MKKSSRNDKNAVSGQPLAPDQTTESLLQLRVPSAAPVESFLNELRNEFLAKGYKANGPLKPDPQRDERIERFISSCRCPRSLQHRTEKFRDAVGLLLRKFERLCERTGKSPGSASFTAKVYRYLAAQFRANVEFFQFSQFTVLLTPTLMTPEPLTTLPQKLKDAGLPVDRALLYRAFTAHSQRVVEFFERGAKRLAEVEGMLSEHPELNFAPVYRKRVAFHHLPQDAKLLVEARARAVDTLLNTKPYSSWFLKQRSIVEAVVVRHKQEDVPRKLKQLHSLTTKLLRDPDLAPFAKRRSAVMYAVLSHFSPHKAKAQLQQAHKLEVTLVRLHKKNQLECHLKEIRDICLKNPDQAIRMAELLSLR
jgi:hypothetical protein